MNIVIKKLTFWTIIGIVSISSYAFVSGYFEVSKNLDIFTSLFREVNIYYVDETKPGETIVITGDHDEFGGWDLTKALKLEYINKNTWFGDFGFHKAAGEPIMIKVAVLKTAETDMRNISQDDYPVLENMLHRHIIIPKKGRMKLDLVWERS
mgnify:CR=1 FL=1